MGSCLILLPLSSSWATTSVRSWSGGLGGGRAPRALAQRSRFVLLAAEGLKNTHIAGRLGDPSCDRGEVALTVCREAARRARWRTHARAGRGRSPMSRGERIGRMNSSRRRAATGGWLGKASRSLRAMRPAPRVLVRVMPSAWRTNAARPSGPRAGSRPNRSL